jgi:hypothetical protein
MDRDKKWIVVSSCNQFETEEEAVAYARKRLCEDIDLLTGVKPRPKYYVPCQYFVAKKVKVVCFERPCSPPPIGVYEVED